MFEITLSDLGFLVSSATAFRLVASLLDLLYFPR